MTAHAVASDTAPVLLIEDNPAHAALILRSFKKHQTHPPVDHLSDGEAALNYLFQRGVYADPACSPRPCLVLLDLRLPKVDGVEVLRQIKESVSLGTIPVVILTTSKGPQDVYGAYR